MTWGIKIAISCALQNVFNGYYQINFAPISVDKVTHSLQRADKIYEFASALTY